MTSPRQERIRLEPLTVGHRARLCARGERAQTKKAREAMDDLCRSCRDAIGWLPFVEVTPEGAPGPIRYHVSCLYPGRPPEPAA